jgi:hypothetical protein
MIKMMRMMLSVLFVLVGCMLMEVEAILPTGQLTIQPGQGKAPYTLLVSQAFFGHGSPMDTKKVPTRILTLPPISNPLLCDNITSTTTTTTTTTSPTMMVVPRGECTFERKALHAQQLGADAILIYGSLASRYSVNKTRHANEKYPTYSKEDIIWPQALYDYDCAMGRAEIPTPDLSFSPLPYNSERNDPILSGDTDDNLCHLYSDTNLRQCSSKLCLLTGKPVDGDDSKEEACCAWDFHIWLYGDHDLHKELPNDPVTIPAAYLTMRQGMQLLKDIQNGSSAGPITAVLTSRYRPKYNPASILIWMLGVFICALAAYLSAGDYHHKIQSVARRLRRQNDAAASGHATQRRVIRLAPKEDDDEDEQDPALSRNAPDHGDSLSRAYAHPEDSLELLPIHALGFIVMASSGLMILFVFKVRRRCTAVGSIRPPALVRTHPCSTQLLLFLFFYFCLISWGCFRQLFLVHCSQT